MSFDKYKLHKIFRFFIIHQMKRKIQCLKLPYSIFMLFILFIFTNIPDIKQV